MILRSKKIQLVSLLHLQGVDHAGRASPICGQARLVRQELALAAHRPLLDQDQEAVGHFECVAVLCCLLLLCMPWNVSPEAARGDCR
jgi:hypothetical protein